MRIRTLFAIIIACGLSGCFVNSSMGMDVCQKTGVCNYISCNNVARFYEALDYRTARKGTSSIKSLRSDIDSLWRVLNCCRTWIVTANSDYSLWDKLEVPVDGEYKGVIWETLAPSVKDIMEKYRVKPDVAERASLLTACQLPWDLAKTTLEKLYEKRSIIGRRYTLEEALFVLNLCPQTKKIAIFYLPHKEDDCRFYAKCLMGSMLAVLQARNAIDKSFAFELEARSGMTEDELVTFNGVKLLREIKLKQPGYVRWLVDDESDVKKKQD